MIGNIFSKTGYLQKGLDAASLRNAVIVNNLANAETPNFKSSSVEFETYFRNALQSGGSFATKRTRDRHISFTPSVDELEATVIPNNITTMRMDGNNVDPDYESAQLAKNQLYYTALEEKLNSEYRRLRMVIEGN